MNLSSMKFIKRNIRFFSSKMFLILILCFTFAPLMIVMPSTTHAEYTNSTSNNVTVWVTIPVTGSLKSVEFLRTGTITNFSLYNVNKDSIWSYSDFTWTVANASSMFLPAKYLSITLAPGTTLSSVKLYSEMDKEGTLLYTFTSFSTTNPLIDIIPPDEVTLLASSNININSATVTFKTPSTSDFKAYKIYRNNTLVYTSPNGTAKSTNFSYNLSSLIASTNYTIKVTTLDTSSNESTGISTVLTTLTPPSKPTGLNAVAGVGQVTLNWNANTGSNIAGYNLYRNGVKINGALITGTTYTNVGLTNGTTYNYTLTAVDRLANESVASTVISAVPFTLGEQVIPTYMSGVGYNGVSGQDGTGLFDGTRVNEWNTNKVFYWYGPGDYVEFKITRSVNIWRSGTTTWSNYSNGLVILRKNIDATYTDVTSTYSLTATSINETQWEKFIHNLPAGTYRVKKSTGSRMDSEWYLEATGVLDTISPATPINVSAIAGDRQVSLVWNPNTETDLQGYNLYRDGVKINTLLLTTTSFVDLGLVNGQTYVYRVSAVDSSENESEASSGVSTIPQVAKPSSPINAESTSRNAKVDLSWSNATGADSYTVKRSTTINGPYDIIASGVIGTIYMDMSVVNGTKYYYIITAVNAGGESSPSNETSATPQVDAPLAPVNVTATAGESRVTLSWNEVTSATSYIIKRATKAGGPFEEVANVVYGTTSYVDEMVVNNITYYYRISASNAGGESFYSNIVSAKPQLIGRALLSIKMVHGPDKEYDLTINQVSDFLDWYNSRSQGWGPAIYLIEKNYNIGPFTKRKDYIVFDTIKTFEVMEYGTKL